MSIATLVEDLLGSDLPIAFRAYDGSTAGPPTANATLVMRSPDALRRIVTAPGELGLARAYVAGDLDLEGDIFEGLAIADRAAQLRLDAKQWVAALRLVGLSGLRPIAPPKEEVRLHGRLHSKGRDAAAIAHHYDVSNAFYRMVLGPSLTYSCAVWEHPEVGLEAAQAAKHELICRKLALVPGMRLLDVGCGWGSLLLHAAEHHGARGVGVTLSRRQAELASKRVAEAGLTGQIEIRVQDYRDVDDGPFDAVSSVGMFEHVGLSQLRVYFDRLHALVRPGGRVLNHAISRPANARRPRIAPRSFIARYVFPDGELHEVGSVVTALQQTGLEARHMESLREHYALTLRAWVANLEANWDAAVAEVGAGRARVWRLYMAASAVNFEANNIQVHQVLGTKTDKGRSGLPLRPRFEERRELVV
jgi:cyclopropane-fatty-acyl-phospholipid synthase